MRILALATGGGGLSAETLFRLGGLCSSLRRACGSVEDAALAAPLAPSWARAVINLVDPAAALLANSSARRGRLVSPAACYMAHARALGGWYKLLHALAERHCTTCGDVTHLVAWRLETSEDGRSCFGLCRCCAECTPPEAADDDSDDEASDAEKSESPGEDESDDEAASKKEIRGIRHCAVVNVQFWSAEPEFVVNAADSESPVDVLQACMEEAVDGDTIGMRGEFKSWIFETTVGKAVRLLGMPAATPYRWVHTAGQDDTPGPLTAQLRRFELDSAAELGFPSASIHVTNNCLGARNAAWLENVFISSGPRDMGSPLPGEHEVTPITVSLFPGDEPAQAFSAVSAYKCRAAISSSTVLRRCWLTGYFGTSFVVAKHSSAALLKCVITNSRFYDFYAPSGATLRIRGCRVMMCSGLTQQRDFGTWALSESLHALFTSVNDIFRFARPASLAAGESEEPERVTTYRPGFDPRIARLLT